MALVNTAMLTVPIPLYYDHASMEFLASLHFLWNKEELENNSMFIIALMKAPFAFQYNFDKI